MSFLKNDTIVAIATAHGMGSVSIVRVSGNDALKIALKLIKKDDLIPRYATFGGIYSLDKEFIDEGIMIYFKSPASFTGEDIVEFQTHGGIIVCNMILNELVKAGARVAKPGEFSKRAFLNNKLDLSKANAISSLINSKNESAAKILARQMRGELEKYADDMRVELVKTLAYVETSIDYADDDLPDNLLAQIQNMLQDNIKKLDNIVSISERRRGLIDGFKIAIIGKPNVGKSSMLNALLNYERAIVSNEAGTTRDRVEESLKIGTHLVKIIDTAGIRSGAGKVEEIGIVHSLKAVDEADIILAVFDSSQESDKQDDRILEILSKSNKKIFYILNKSDLQTKFDKNLVNPLKISTKNSLESITNAINEYLNMQDSSELMLSQASQITACKTASDALKRASQILSESELELFAYEINVAIKCIASMTRPFEYSEVLDEMFSSFCLGK